MLGFTRGCAYAQGRVQRHVSARGGRPRSPSLGAQHVAWKGALRPVTGYQHALGRRRFHRSPRRSFSLPALSGRRRLTTMGAVSAAG